MLPHDWTLGYPERRLRRRVARLSDGELREWAADAKQRVEALRGAQGHLLEAGELVGRVYGLAAVRDKLDRVNRRLGLSNWEVSQERVFLIQEARSRGFKIDD